MVNNNITTKAFISGLDGFVYSVPKEIAVKCTRSKDCKKSKGCVVLEKKKFEIDAEASLQFVELNNIYYKRTIQSVLQLNCSRFSYTISKIQSLIRLFIIEADFDSATLTAYLVDSSVEINRNYEFTGTIVADPRTQSKVYVFTSAKIVPTAIESFSVSKEVHDKLNEFKVDGNSEDIMLHFYKLYSSYAANVTHIYDRYDLHLACDLAYHSPLSFIFDGEYVHKGWADVAIIGDTRCGKNFVAVEGFMKHYGVGEVVSADNASITGLIGGIQRSRNSWTVKWGKIPRNDSGLLVIDESLKLSSSLISKLDSLRSEGKAEIHRIQSYTTNARTRLIWLINAPFKTISQYPYGILSLSDVFKAPQNISRFDYALVVAREEANIDDINSSRKTAPLIYSQELERKLIHWIWSRKKEEIVFSDKAVDKIYLLSLDLADTYSFTVPLIQGENIRYKLAKIAACIAGRVYSNKRSGKYLFVDVEHVECAWIFLNLIYKKPASGYFQMSKIKKSFDMTSGKNGIESFDNYINTFQSKRVEILQCLLMNNTIAMSDIQEQTGIARDIAHEIVSKLVRFKLIERRGFSYGRTEQFTQFLRNELSHDK